METENVKDDAFWSRALVVFFCVAIAISVGAAFYKFFVLRDYSIQTQAKCDPYTEECFIHRCDSTAEECTGDPATDTSYYKLVDRKAKNIPLCNPAEEGCDVTTCSSNEDQCVVTLCDVNTVEAAVECSNPAVYSQEHLPVEDMTSNTVDPIE